MNKGLLVFLSYALINLSLTAQAGDATNYKVLGFSANGTFFAFAQTGISDGSGFAFAEVTVIDTSKNSVVKSVLEASDNETTATTDENIALKKAISKLKLNTFGITPGKNLGKTVINRLNTDLSSYSNTLFSVDYWPEGGASATLKKYELGINSLSVPAGQDTECADWMPSALLKLTIKGIGSSSLPETILQQDNKIPKSRGMCPNSYRVQNVTVFGSKLAIAVQFSRVGFEGPDERTLVVTTDIPELK